VYVKQRALDNFVEHIEISIPRTLRFTPSVSAVGVNIREYDEFPWSADLAGGKFGIDRPVACRLRRRRQFALRIHNPSHNGLVEKTSLRMGKRTRSLST
jgi:hypothetical protein